jgi:NAD-dependent SIR2 family protein deacetylase
MAKLYKLKHPDNTITEHIGYNEFKCYLENLKIGKTQIFESLDKNRPTRAGYQLLEIVNIEKEDYEVTCDLCGKKIKESEVAGKHEGSPQCKECWGKWHGAEDVKNDEKLVEGKTERKPKYEAYDDYYIIRYGNNKQIKITEEELSRFKKLYCGTHSLTMEEIGLEFNMLREEVYAIKTAFDIIKQSNPYTDREIDSMSVEEMAENTRINKKKAYLRRLNELKVKDMEDELKKLHKKDYYMNKVIEAMKDVKVKDYDEVIESPSKLTYIVNLADLHVGASVHNMINDYNLEEFKKRMAKYAEEVFREMSWLNPERIIVINLGDSINGILNQANRIESDCGLIESVKCTTEEIASFLRHLSHFGKVEYYNVYGNHSNIHKDKILNIEEENLERLITWGLSNIFSESKRIEIHPAEDVIGIEVYGKLVACQHGHNNISVEKLTGKFDKVPRLSLHGHFHNFQIQTKGNTECVQVGTMMGSDSYAMSKGFIGKPSQLLIVIDENWKVEYKPIYFDSKVGV